MIRPNHRAALDAATTRLLHSEHHWRRASERGRYAAKLYESAH